MDYEFMMELRALEKFECNDTRFEKKWSKRGYGEMLAKRGKRGKRDKRKGGGK